MGNAPKRIWASAGETWDGFEEGSTWDSGLYTREKENAYDLQYIRADLVPQWKPIETAPRDGTDVQLWDGNYISNGCWRLDDYIQEGGPMWLKDDYDDFSCGYASTPLNPTHWMPMPTPPNEPKRAP